MNYKIKSQYYILSISVISTWTFFWVKTCEWHAKTSQYGLIINPVDIL